MVSRVSRSISRLQSLVQLINIDMEAFQTELIENKLKICELEDEESEGFNDFNEDQEITLKFKDQILKNKKKFKEELLKSPQEINHEQIFEFPTTQENDGESHNDMMIKMDQMTLDIPMSDIIEGENHLLKIAEEHMIPLPDNPGIFKRICRKGEGKNPQLDSIVTIHYNAYLEDEISSQIKPFDSTVLRGRPFSFMRGQGSTIEGLDIAVGSMKAQEQSEFIFTPELAFGFTGCPPRIPPNAYVLFHIDLIEWVDSSAAESFHKLPMTVRKSLPFSQVLEAAKSEKCKAHHHFQKQSYNIAGKCYLQALNWIQEHRCADEIEEHQRMDLSLKLYLNLALVNLKVNKPKKTCTYCQEALAIDPNNTKALYRYGLAQEKLGNFDKAKQLVLKAKATSPLDASITRSLLEISKKIAKEVEIEKNYCQRIMGSVDRVRQRPQSESESIVVLRNQLSRFVANDAETEIVFSQGLTKDERDFLQSQAKDLQLKFCMKPLLNGDAVCTVSKLA